MAQATLKDGRIIEFPDGLPPEQAKMIIQKATADGPSTVPALKTFLITAPNGKKYKVGGDNSEGALNAVKAHEGQSAPESNITLQRTLQLKARARRRLAEKDSQSAPPKMQEFRAKYPQYDDMSDADLAQSIHKKYYSDMPFGEFATKVGLKQDRNLTPSRPEEATDIDAMIAKMDPTDLQIARSKNDEFGAYLRSKAQEHRPGETAEQREQRLYGSRMPDVSKTQSFVRGAADTLSWGGGDEMAAGLEALTGQRSYDNALENQRRVAQEASAKNPKSYLTGQVAGAVAPALATGGLTSGQLPATLTGKALTSSVTGAIQGGTYGFLTGEEGFQDRLKNAGVNAGIGAGIGVAAPLAGKAVGAAWRGVANLLTSRGVDGRAARHLLDMLEKSGLSPEQAHQRIAEMGPEAMLADLAPGMQAEAAGTARASTGAGNVMAERLARRREAGPIRLVATLDDAFGRPVDPFTMRESTRAAKAAISPEYRAAIANAPELPKSTADILARGLTDPTKGLSMENRAVMGKYMTQIDDALAADSPSETASRLLDLRKNLDSQIVYGRAQAMLSPSDRATQGVTRQARAFVDDVLKKHVPGLLEADAKHAPISKLQSAFDIGRKDVLRGGSNTMTPAEVRALVSRNTPAETNMIGQGLRTELDRILSNQRGNPSAAVDRITSRDWNGAKIESIIGPDKAGKVANALENENTFLETSNLVEPSRGSRTSVLESAKARWGNAQAKPGFIGDVLSSAGTGGAIGGLSGAGAAVAGTVVNRLRQGIVHLLMGKNNKLIDAVGENLTRTGNARDDLVNILAKTKGKIAGRAAKADSIADLIRLLIMSGGRVPMADHFSASHASR